MSEKYRVIVPLDGSELSERVLPWARLWGRAYPELEVELLRCFEPPSSLYLIPELAVPATTVFDEGNLRRAMHDYLEQKAERLGLSGTLTEVAMADPASEILQRAEQAQLIMMASHGRGGLGRWLLGSVATKVTRGSTSPVLVVSAKCWVESEGETPAMETLLVAYDGSPAAERAVETAADLARRWKATLHIYQGVTQVAMAHQLVIEANRAELLRTGQQLQAMASALEGLTVYAEVREASVSTGIVEYAEEIGAHLVVIGSHGKSGLERWMIGSETEHVLQQAPCPVLVTH